MANVKIPTLHNESEFIINLIRLNCYNPDDLSKISMAVENMLDNFIQDEPPKDIRQVLVTGNKDSR
jgi:hypothetical protein